MATRFRLREILDQQGMSQSELARRARLSPATVNRLYLNQTGAVSLSTLDRIAAVLGVEPGDLIVRDRPRRTKRV